MCHIPDGMYFLFLRDPGLPADDAHDRRAGPEPLPGIEQAFSGFAPPRCHRRISACSGAFYVPVYSSVSIKPGKGWRGGFLGDAEHPHNAFGDAPPLGLANGSHISTPMGKNGGKTTLKAAGGAENRFSTIEVFRSPPTDVRGGTGANFVVDWAATGEIAEPAVEALMFGGLGSGPLCVIYQPGPAIEGRRQELACRAAAIAGPPSSTRK